MLNIERYRSELNENKRFHLECEIYRIRKEIVGENGFCRVKLSCVECRKKCIEWLCSEYKEPILTEEEKAYLSAVIKPFRKKVKHIVKINLCSSPEEQFIRIVIGNLDFINFPNFNKNTGMYKGMEADKLYSLEELGL